MSSDREMFEQYRQMWQSEYADKPVYTLRDMMAGKPYKDAETIEEMFNQFNKTLPRDRQFDKPRSARRLKNLDLMFTSAPGLNKDDVRKYHHPDTKVKASTNMGPLTMGYVQFPNKEKGIAGDTMNLAAYDPRDSDTVLHEASHIDSNLAPTQGYFLGEKRSPLDSLYFKLMEDTKKKKDFAKRYITSGNYGDSIDEIRAELRASLGMAPKGTTARQHFSPLLEHLFKDKNIFEQRQLVYDPNQLPPGAKQPTLLPGNLTKRTLTNENVYDLLERDLFPRERWIEPREPTVSERIQDFINNLLKR